MHFRVARVQDTDKFVDQRICCHSRVVSVNDATRTITTFAFRRLFVFLSGFRYSVPGIRHRFSYWLMLQKSNSKHGWAVRIRYLTWLPKRIEFHFSECQWKVIFKGTNILFEMFIFCGLCGMCNVSEECFNLGAWLGAEENYASGFDVGENSILIVQFGRLSIFNTAQTILMFHGDPLFRLGRNYWSCDEICLWNYCISITMNASKFFSQKLTIVHLLDGN